MMKTRTTMSDRAHRIGELLCGLAERIRPDPRDVLFFGGLATLGFGVWMIFPPAALIVVGAILTALGKWG